MKEVNRYTSGEFHDWHRANVSRALVVQDLDAFALLFSRSDKPAVLIEVKRSFIPVAQWRPFPADRNNYAALLALADAAGIPLWIVYHLKDEPMTNASAVHWFHLTKARPDYQGTHRIITAGELARRIDRHCERAPL